MKWWVVLALAALVVGRGDWVVMGLVFVGGGAVLYWISLHRHPRRRCRACHGTGRHQGAMFWWGNRACTKCAGTPHHRRWGVQLFHGAAGKRTWAEERRFRATTRRGAPR
jgi:hypothetical protein